ncbi:MAG: AI-2E family transporter [Pseudomonadota bacterium]
MSDTAQHKLRIHDWNAIKRFVIFVAILVALVYGLAIFYASITVPVFIAAFLAYLMNPLVNALETRKVPRSVASLIILFLIFGLVSWAAVRLFPYLYEQLIGLVQQVPSLIDSFSKKIGLTLRETLKEYGIRDNGAVDHALKGFNLFEQGIARLQIAAQGVVNMSAGLMGSILGLVLVPILAFYFVAEKARLIQSIRRVTPRDLRPYGIRVANIVDETLTNVIRGHIKVALTLACLYSIGFSAIGLSAGVAIGIAAGICRVIPYLDVVVGLTLGVTYIFTQQISSITVFWLVGVIGTVQILDGVLITPRLIGSKVGLHPMVVILTVMASGAQFGFWGVLLAIPGAALIKALYKLVLPVYRDSSWFTGR